MKFIDAIFKGRPTRVVSDTPVPPDVLTLRNGVRVPIIQWNSHIAAEQALSHPIVAPALEKIANSFKQVGWIAAEDPKASAADRRGKSAVIQRINDFLLSPHDELTPSMLRYWMALNWACYGRIPYKVGFEAMHQTVPNGIWPLEARYVTAKKDGRGVVASYTYGSVETAQTFRSRLAAGVGQDFIDQIWKPSLSGTQGRADNNSPLSTVGLPAQVIKSLLIRAINTAEGHPNCGYIVTADSTMLPDQINAVTEVLNDHHNTNGPNSGEIPILNNVPGFKIHTLPNDLSDIHTKTPTDDMKRLIYTAFGIPIALAGIGAADAAKFAGNFDESRATFWEDTIDPAYVDPIFGGLTQSLCPVGVCIKPVYDDVPAMQGRRVQKMASVNNIDFLTTTEKRAMFGLKEDNSLSKMTGGATPTTGTTGDE